MSARAAVLVVGDEEVVRRSHVRVLGSAHCHVEAVGDGEQALRAMAQQPLDLVLLDLRMPDIDGRSVLRTMKRRWPECEVIVVTRCPCVDAARESICLGAHDYLAKPLAPGEVIEAANSAMTHKHGALRFEADGTKVANVATRTAG